MRRQGQRKRRSPDRVLDVVVLLRDGDTLGSCTVDELEAAFPTTPDAFSHFTRDAHRSRNEGGKP